MPEPNGDTKLIIHRIDQLGTQFTKLEEKFDKYHESSSVRLKDCELRQALLEQANLATCADIADLQEKSNRNDIIAGVTGAITGAATAVIGFYAYLRSLIP